MNTAQEAQEVLATPEAQRRASRHLRMGFATAGVRATVIAIRGGLVTWVMANATNITPIHWLLPVVDTPQRASHASIGTPAHSAKLHSAHSLTHSTIKVAKKTHPYSLSVARQPGLASGSVFCDGTRSPWPEVRLRGTERQPSNRHDVSGGLPGDGPGNCRFTMDTYLLH